MEGVEIFCVSSFVRERIQVINHQNKACHKCRRSVKVRVTKDYFVYAGVGVDRVAIFCDLCWSCDKGQQ